MTEYLSYAFNDDDAFMETFDELPLWSAPFGLLMLEHLKLRRNLTVLDIGSGSGFPLMELAGRLGSSSQCYGLDPWINANKRARRKTINYGLTNVEVLDGSGDKIPFDDSSIDLIVSNLGINNFENPEIVFGECYRVLKPGGRLALTTNLAGHWKEFHDIFENTLRASGHNSSLEKLIAQQEHRGTIASITDLFTAAGFTLTRHVESSFQMKFLDGSAFLNHYFVKLGWLESWKKLLPTDELLPIFSSLETNLNRVAEKAGELVLTVPMAFIEGKKAPA